MGAEFIEVGVVQELNRYPVKSMRGESLAKAYLYWHGFDGDRRWAFVRSDHYSGFPWLTGREVPQMLLYRPFFLRPEDVDHSTIAVQTPDGRTLPIDSEALRQELADAHSKPIHLIKIGRGAYDSQVLSLMSTATARDLSRQAGMTIVNGRFRQNIIIDTFVDQPYLEESWLDKGLIFGGRSDSARIRLNRRIQRCVMVTIDPETAVKEPRVLATVAQTRHNCVGVYGATEKTGSIQVGDIIRLVG